MIVGHLHIQVALSLFVFIAAQRCAGDVTIHVNDTRLITVPPGIWTNEDRYDSMCGGLRKLLGTGESVSFAFSGTAVAIVFLRSAVGEIAAITLDGRDVTNIDTFGDTSSDTTCIPISWTSSVLVQENHNITVVALPFNQRTLPYPWLLIRNVSYTPVTAGGYPGPKKPRKSSTIGVIVGSVAAVVLVCSVWFLLHRRRRRHASARIARRAIFLNIGDSHPVERPGANIEEFILHPGHRYCISSELPIENTSQLGMTTNPGPFSRAHNVSDVEPFPSDGRFVNAQLDVVQGTAERAVPRRTAASIIQGMLPSFSRRENLPLRLENAPLSYDAIEHMPDWEGYFRRFLDWEEDLQIGKVGKRTMTGASLRFDTSHFIPAMTVTAITSIQQFKEIINSGKYVVIDFWADWCGPCKMISPVFEQLSGATPGVEFYKVDVDNQEQISQEVGIRAMPTFMLFKDGNKVKELVGANPGGLKNLVAGLA